MTLWNAVHDAIRTWRHSPGMATGIVCTLALSIGAATIGFAIYHSILVQEFPFPDADRLVWITTHDSRNDDADRPVIESNRLPQFADWQQHLTSFEQVGAWAGEAPDVVTLTGAGTPERVSGLRVTHQLLPMLGGSPALGRLFRVGEDAPRARQTVVLSHGYWQRRFAGRVNVVGQSITIENMPHVVIGVLSTGFPLSGSLFAGAPIDVFLPLSVDGNEDIGRFMAVVGRLRPGVTVDVALADLANRQTALSVGKWQWMTVLAQQVSPLSVLVTRDARLLVKHLFASSLYLLVMACANVAILLLVRASGRRREMRLRAALGASMPQLFGQATAESAVLVGTGGVAGLVLASAVVNVVGRTAWLSVARLGDLQVGWPAFVFATALSAVITVVFTGVALLHLRRRDIVDGLRPHAGTTADPRAVYVQRLAVATQVAIGIVLTVTGGLMLRSLTALLDVDPGFDPHGAIAIRVDPAGRLNDPDRLPFFNQVIERVAAVPGVQSAGMTIHVPMGEQPSMGWDAIPQGREYNPVTDNAAGRIVSPGYFTAAGIQLVEGRDFDSRDVRVIAVNESFARRIRAEGGEPLGMRMRVIGNGFRVLENLEVVAVVSDVRHVSLNADGGREVYIPMGQAPPFFQAYDLIVRATDPIALVSSIRDAIWEIDRNQALGTPVLLEDYIGRTLQPRRLLTGVSGALAVTALLLAAFGVYCVVVYGVAQRMKEIAIRVALGAPRWSVTGMVLRDTVTCVCVGLAAGLPLSLAAAEAIRSYLFGVEPGDGVTLATACSVVIAAALLSAYLPARRAPRVDPISALRIE